MKKCDADIKRYKIMSLFNKYIPNDEMNRFIGLLVILGAYDDFFNNCDINMLKKEIPIISPKVAYITLCNLEYINEPSQFLYLVRAINLVRLKISYGIFYLENNFIYNGNDKLNKLSIIQRIEMLYNQVNRYKDVIKEDEYNRLIKCISNIEKII